MARVLAVFVLLAATTATTPACARTVAEIRQDQAVAAARAHAGALTAYRNGAGPLEPVYLWSCRWLQAERAVKPADALPAAARHRDRMATLRVEVTQRVAAGVATPADSDAAAYYSAEAELWAAGAT